jgi:hypothetical protein
MSRLVHLLPICLLGACVSGGDETVVILQNQYPAAGCMVPSTATGQFIGSGIIDTATSQGYVFTPLVQNYSTSDGTTADRSHIAFVTGVDVDLSFTDTAVQGMCTGNPNPCSYEVPYAAMIAPGGDSGMAFEIVSASLVHSLASHLTSPDQRELILADVAMVGTLNNGDFTSNKFRFPVEVCNGCTINDLGACSTVSASFQTKNLGGACNLYQDLPLDCCTDASGGEVCPAVGTGP